MKRLLVIALERSCEFIDQLPDWTWRVPLLHRLGCPHGLALVSEQLDQRWQTGQWYDPKNDPTRMEEEELN